MGKQFFGIVFLLVASLGVVGAGCARDRTDEDYRRERADQDFAKIQKAEGVYTGVVKSRADGAVLGELTLRLSAQTKVAAGISGEKAVQQPVLVGNLEFQGARRMVLVAQDGYYDPETRRYQAYVPINESEHVQLTGKIRGDKMKGAIEAFGFSEFGGSFTLVRGKKRASAELQAILSAKEEGDSRLLKSYAGTTTFNAVSRPVSLFMLEPRLSSEQEFRGVFVPVKPLQVTLNYGSSLRVLFTDALWDERTGRLTAQTELVRGGGRAQLMLECRKDGMGDLECDHFTSDQGRVARTRVSLVAEGSLAPVSDFQDADPVLESYAGQMEFAGTAQARSAVLNVLRPRKPRDQQLMELFFPDSQEPVQATLSFGGGAFSIHIQNALWDLSAGTLSGSYQVGTAGTLTLDCRRAPGAAPYGLMDCRHYTSSAGLAAESRFSRVEPGSVRLVDRDHSFRSQVSRFYRGRAFKTVSERDQGRGGIPVAMTAMRLARTHEQDLMELLFPTSEKALQLALQFYEDSTASVRFDLARWDEELQIVTGSAVPSTDERRFEVSLRCENFALSGSAEPFECEYFSNRGKRMWLRFDQFEQ